MQPRGLRSPVPRGRGGVQTVLVAIVLLAGHARGQNLLSYGSFESPDVRWANSKGMDLYSFPSCPTAFGWFMQQSAAPGGGSIDIMNCLGYPVAGCYTTNGYQFIDINGNAPGGICQYVLTPGAGAVCDLYFSYAPNTDGGPGVRSITFSLNWDYNNGVNFAYGLNSYARWQWTQGPHKDDQCRDVRALLHYFHDDEHAVRDLLGQFTAVLQRSTGTITIINRHGPTNSPEHTLEHSSAFAVVHDHRNKI